MISRRMMLALCLLLFALTVPALAQDEPFVYSPDMPVISADNGAHLSFKGFLSPYLQGTIGLRAIPDTTMFTFETYIDEYVEEDYAAAEGAPGPVYPSIPPSATVLDYTGDPGQFADIARSLAGNWILSPDGHVWAAYYRDFADPAGPTELQLVDFDTEEVTATLFSDYISTSIQAPASVYFSPGSNFLIMDDGDLTIWNVHTGEQLDLEISGDKIAFNFDETLLAAGDVDKSKGSLTVKVWNIETGELVSSIEDPIFGFFLTIIMAPHENLMFINGADRRFLWDLDADKDVLPRPGLPSFFSGDGKTFVLATILEASTTLHFWDFATQTDIATQTFPSGNPEILMDKTGSRVVVYADGLNALVLNGVTGEAIAKLKMRDLGPAIFSPDGHLLLTWKGRAFTLWSLDTGKALGEFEMASPDGFDVPVEIEDLAFSADGTVLLILPSEGQPEVWTVGD